MGNKANFIQCGIDDPADQKQEVYRTREEAIPQNQNSDMFNSQVQSTNISSSKLQKDSQKNKPLIIPEHENIIRVSSKPKTGYIGPKGVEYYHQERGKCLDQIIESRFNSSMHFPQNQVIGLIECLVYSLAYLSKKTLNNHDFYPTSIFYLNGKFKIENPLLSNISSYSLTQKRKRFSFLSPQLILEVLNDTNQENIMNYVLDKADVFAIGMILLEFCTLSPSSQCYDPETYSLIDSVIHQRVEKTRELYQPMISDCIDLMLQYQVQKRIGPQELSYVVHSNIQMASSQILPPQVQRPGQQIIRPPMGNAQQMHIPPNGYITLQQLAPPPSQGYIVHGGPNGMDSCLISQSSHPRNQFPPPPSHVQGQPMGHQMIYNPMQNQHIKSSVGNPYKIPMSSQKPPQFNEQTSEQAQNFIASDSSYIKSIVNRNSLGVSTKSKNKSKPFEDIQENSKEQNNQSTNRRSPIYSNSNYTNQIMVPGYSNQSKSSPVMQTVRNSQNQVYGNKDYGLDERVRKILEASKNIK